MGSNETLGNGFLLRGRYKIEGMVGSGGMGRVYKAWDTEYGRFVAVKEMKQNTLSSGKLAEAQRQFEKEAAILKKLKPHPHIPQFYDSFSQGGRSYLVMQFIEGQNLLQLMRAYPNEQLPIDKVIDYALQLCDVLSYLHQQTPPVIFRDLKPENVMVTTGNVVYLIDFGIARFFNPDKLADTLLFMSAGYAAPEAFWDDLCHYPSTEPRSDLYSLGATLYHCVTGFHPKNNQPSHFNFQPARQRNGQVPSSLDAFLLKLVSTNKDNRYADAQQAGKELLRMRSAASDTTLKNRAGQHDVVADTFYEPNTGRAVELYMSLAKLNKLPGVFGKLWDKMTPFFTAVGIWYVHSCMPFIQQTIEGIGKLTVKSWDAAWRPRKRQSASSAGHRARPANAPGGSRRKPQPLSPRSHQPGHQMRNAAQVVTIMQPSQQKQLPRQSGGIFAVIARADPVPYASMLLTTVGISTFMLWYLHLSPLLVLLVLSCLLGLFSLLAGTTRKMALVAQNLFGATIVCTLVVIVMLLALPGVQAFTYMFTFAQLFCALLLLIGLTLLFRISNTTKRLRRLLQLAIVPLYLLLNQVSSTMSLQTIVRSQNIFLAMHPFSPVNFNMAIFSLLVLLAIEALYSLIRRSVFLVAQVLSSLALVMGCIVFIAGWGVSTHDLLGEQANFMQWMQWIVAIGLMLVVLVIVICLPYREVDEESYVEAAYAVLRVIEKLALALSIISCMTFIWLLLDDQLIQRIDNDPVKESNLEFWLLWLLVMVGFVGIGTLFTLWQFWGNASGQNRDAYGRRVKAQWMKWIEHALSFIDSFFLLVTIGLVLYLWQDQHVQSPPPSSYLPFHVPTGEPTFSILLISSFAGLSCVFWFWQQRPIERIKRGTLIFYNSCGMIALAVAVGMRIIFWADPEWFELAMIVAIVFLAQALLVVMRAEQELAQVPSTSA